MSGSRASTRRLNILSPVLYVLAAISVLFGVFVLLAMLSISANLGGFVPLISGFGGPLGDAVAGYVQAFLNFIAAMTFLLLLVIGVTLFIQARLVSRWQDMDARVEALERRLADSPAPPRPRAPVGGAGSDTASDRR
ncbi:MAG: hypothetical protein U0768_00225 [Anaerolineae bacterium]